MTQAKKTTNGLYLITPALSDSQPERWLARIQGALKGGAKALQFRDKSNNQQYRLQMARELLQLCHAVGIPLIINDDVSLAKQVQADGVHLGQDDIAIGEARRILGPQAIIGVSCYNQLSLAESAERAGADYVAFGRFFPSLTKPNAVQADLALLSQAALSLRCPIIAIGGITVDNASSVIQAGASAIALIEAVFSEADTYQAAKTLQALF